LSGGKVILVPGRDCEKMQGAILKGVWLWCLHKMARRRGKQRIRSGSGFAFVPVQAGQFAYQRGMACEETGLAGSTIHDRMGELVSLKKITYWSPPDSPWTIVTIVDYRRYVPHLALAATTQKGTADGFDVFWEAWPQHFRKKAPGKCRKEWIEKGLSRTIESVMAVLASDLRSDQWRKDNKQYIPAPLVWLRGDQWQAGVGDLPPSPAEMMAAAQTAPGLGSMIGELAESSTAKGGDMQADLDRLDGLPRKERQALLRRAEELVARPLRGIQTVVRAQAIVLMKEQDHGEPT